MEEISKWYEICGLIALVLIVPGPTNTLLFSSGIRKGLSGTFPLVVAEAIGYSLSIMLWGFSFLALAKDNPWVYSWIKVACACYILWLAYRMWVNSDSALSSNVKIIGFKDVLIATLLNPKALLFSSVILPATSFQSISDFIHSLMIFLLILFPVGIIWSTLGGLLRMSDKLIRYTGIMLRMASSILLFFSFSLAYSGIAKAEGKLIMLNWQNYTSPELIAKFENEHNVNVTLVEYKSSEEALDAVRKGTIKADLAVIADNSLREWVSAGLLTEIGKSRLENFNHIKPSWRSTPADPQRRYSIPWAWGVVGVAVHTNIFKGNYHSWKIVLDPPEELAGTINVGADMNELIYAGIRLHGGKMCDAKPAILEKVRQTLLTARPSWAAMDYGDITMMASGKFKASIDWNGAALRQRQLNPDIRFGYPKEGTQIFSDDLVLLAHAENKRNALNFMNFILHPENAALNSLFHGYDSAVAGASSYLPAWLNKAPEFNVPQAVIQNAEYAVNCPSDVQKKYEEIWQELKTYR